jgi:hypothetical protein
MSRRLGWFVAVLFLCGLQMARGTASAQEVDRSVVIDAEAAGRLMPGGSGSPSGAKRYWADAAANSIRRSNLDGSGIEDVVTGTKVPYGLSYDAMAGALLWTSSGDEVVQKLDSGGKGFTPLQTDFEEPFGITVTEEGRKIGYAVLEGQVVKIIQYDDRETDEQEILMKFDPEVQPVHGLALDEQAGVLYVGNINGMMTQKVRLADNRVETLAYVEETFPGQPGTPEKAK